MQSCLVELLIENKFRLVSLNIFRKPSYNASNVLKVNHKPFYCNLLHYNIVDGGYTTIKVRKQFHFIIIKEFL